MKVICIILCTLAALGDCANNELISPNTTSCACPGDILTFICNIVGGGTTLWSGTSFMCDNDPDEIILRHTQFSSGTRGSCNDGAIQGESIGVENNCYSSRLLVNVSAGFNGKTVECVYSFQTSTTIGVVTLSVLTGAVPANIRVSDLNSSSISFSWNSVTEGSCYDDQYFINATNCGNCPTMSDFNSTTCSGLDVSVSNTLECLFSVHAVICGKKGDASRTLLTILKVPERPVVNILPLYSGDSGRISSITLEINQTGIVTSVSDPIGVLNYAVISDPICLMRENLTPCGDNLCSYVVNVPSSCRTNALLNISVVATNLLGDGQPSEFVTVDVNNRFVIVEYDTAESTLSCIFVNQQDNSTKICKIKYGLCQQGLSKSNEETTTTEMAVLTLQLGNGQTYCYQVEASNRTYTVLIEGSLSTGGSNTNLFRIVVPAAVGGVILIAIPIVIVIIAVVSVYSCKKQKYDAERSYHMLPLSVASQLNLQPVKLEIYHSLHVEYDCELREYYVKKTKKTFRRGCVFFEFDNDRENITEEMHLLFLEKNKKKHLLHPDISTETLKEKKLLGEGVKNPRYKDYTIFIQCTGLGSRYIKKGSTIYCVETSQQQEPRERPLRPIFSEQLMLTLVNEDTTLEKFCEVNDISLNVNRNDLFLDHRNIPKFNPDDVIDVVLLDKRSKMFTGPLARRCVKEGQVLPDENDRQWTVFVCAQNQLKKDMSLAKGTGVLHQNKKHFCYTRKGLPLSDHFYEFEVKKDFTKMSTLVESNLGKGSFKNGWAFYELKDQEEDLLYIKEVVRANKKKFWSSVDLFYSTGVPGFGVTRDTDHFSVFVQSTSQGSRCLRKGTRLLYKKFDDPTVI